MDPSVGAAYDGSESPTQINDDRSYDRYEDPASLPSINLRTTQEQSGLGDDFLGRSLDENDSGAVNFDSLDSGGLDFESPIAADDEERRNNGISHFFARSDHDPVSTTVGLAPETPAPPKNPFAGKFQTPLVAGSQLFAQTPFSAAFNQASPTSSRPSPSDLPVQATITPHGGTSSALKPRFPMSNPGEQTPMPLPMFHNLSTSSQSRSEGTTPFPGAPTAPVVQQSSPTTRRKRTPAPIEEYEPMRKSQERRNAASEARLDLGNGYGSSSDENGDDTTRQRRRRVQLKREEATKILSGISIAGPIFRDDIVEVPASTRKEARPRSSGKQQGPRVLKICPESDPPTAHTEAAARKTAKTAKPFEGPRSSLPESVYEELSFPQSMIDAAYNTKILPVSKTPSSSAVSLPEISATVIKHSRPPLHPKSSLNEADAIPETSPVVKRAASTVQSPIQITSDPLEAPPVSSSGNPEHALSLQPAEQPRGALYINHESPSQNNQVVEVISLLKQGAHQEFDTAEAVTSSPPLIAPGSFYIRSQKKRQHCGDAEEVSGGRTSLAASISSVDRSVSSLSSLSATPTQVSREGTPITENDSDKSTRASDKKHNITADTDTDTAAGAIDAIDDDDSPHLPRRRRRHETASLPNIRQEHESYMRLSTASSKRRPSPIPSGSTDELAASPSSLAVTERRTRSSRKFVRTASSRTVTLVPVSHRRESSALGLFAGMLFSVTFQSKRRGESDADFTKREKQGEKLQARILEEGGSILPDGFDALFRSPQIITHATSTSRLRTELEVTNATELQLLPHAAQTGFAALISDGHSRKAKYMQALALGLPCLAPRWVTTCLERNELVDWSPYLLCAGESSFLGGAIRSRNLASYDASTARLADIIQTRRRLFEGLAILVLLRKSTREAYIFLAHVLGASLTRVHTIQEAREQLKAMEDAGHPFDWVYTDEETELDAVFHDRAASRLVAKRRKRQSSTNDTDRAPAFVKILSDERFIQSLIFGKLIEEDDLGG